ncbi:hypothetical protein OG402_11830 [Streptomyces anulatus]|uniref:hypothetical protein n=1 Tax=Streptomyces anulatus TaxID=1892 RepID=UPI002251F112|nr:hypothetical protein [Streptomyces anulatus]MCX4601177.1 hypothetical protein [Streptomyces anulatus]
MTAELVRHQPAAPATLPEKMEYARALAVSGMLPSQYRNQPANLLYALEFAGSLGLHPMAAITGVHVIEGKPSASSALISALVRRAGHKLRVTGNDEQATAQIVRCDDPEFVFECTWTWARADRAGLTGKKVWKNYPAAMLKARAITEVAREACEEALSGMHYTPEELGANVNEDGLPVEAEVQQLHRVQPGEGDPWTTPLPTNDVGGLSEWKHYLVGADEAADADAVRALWQEARQDGAPANVLNEIAKVGKAKAAAPTVETKADDEGVVDGEVVTTPEDDYANAVAELRDAAEAAHLDDFDAGVTGALGMPLADAPVDAIRALAAQIRPAAA